MAKDSTVVMVKSAALETVRDVVILPIRQSYDDLCFVAPF